MNNSNEAVVDVNEDFHNRLKQAEVRSLRTSYDKAVEEVRGFPSQIPQGCEKDYVRTRIPPTRFRITRTGFLRYEVSVSYLGLPMQFLCRRLTAWGARAAVHRLTERYGIARVEVEGLY